MVSTYSSLITYTASTLQRWGDVPWFLQFLAVLYILVSSFLPVQTNETIYSAVDYNTDIAMISNYVAMCIYV